MNFKNIVNILIETFPELNENYIKELEDWKEEVLGAYIIFGDVLNPFILNKLSVNLDKEFLTKIFDFF